MICYYQPLKALHDDGSECHRVIRASNCRLLGDDLEEKLHFLAVCLLCNPYGAIQVGSSCPQSHQVTRSESSRAARTFRVIQGFSFVRMQTFFILLTSSTHFRIPTLRTRPPVSSVMTGCFPERVPVHAVEAVLHSSLHPEPDLHHCGLFF